MSVIVICGIPASGKSEFVDEFAKHAPCEVIRPLVTGDIQSWYDTLNDAVGMLYHNKTDKHIVVDTCGATPGNFTELFTMSTVRSVDVKIIYVHSSVQDCIERWGEGGDVVIAKYVVRIKKAVKEYQSKYKVIAVRNDGTIEDLRDKAREAAINIGAPTNNTNPSA